MKRPSEYFHTASFVSAGSDGTNTADNFDSSAIPGGATAATESNAQTILSAVKNADRPTLQSTANPHFAGGMVYEMQIGSFGAICSAHKQYFDDGGFDFVHADGVDDHAVYKGSEDFDKAPPERLACAHRHGKPDLFMRVGSTSAIVVNGGMPF
jgi:hypothetical protein